MKKILITGSESYIGTSVERYLACEPNHYLVDTLDMRNPSWKEENFSCYDSVFHVAGIVHLKEKKGNEDLYYKINRDLAVETAKKAKTEGVRQFIFMSSMSVYGEVGKIGEKVIITKDTPASPDTFYGRSKIEAENALRELEDTHFKIAILRPPMVYGPNCPGNYRRLEKLASKIPVFPMIDNERSMVHIDHLCCFIKYYIDQESHGLFFPQDEEYVNTSILFQQLAEKYGKNVLLSRGLGKFVIFIGKNSTILNKLFGNLVYSKQ